MSDKKYIHPAQKRQDEHEKRKEKKKKKRGFLWFLLLLLLLAALLGGIGWGQGWFNGKGKTEDTNASGSDSAVERTVPEESQADESSAARTPVAIKVSGSSYIYNDSLRTYDQLKNDLSVLDKNAVIIEITDDNAVANAMMDLHSLLEELALPFSDIPAAAGTTASAADSSSAETVTTTTAAQPLV